MRIDLPQCDFSECRRRIDGNCNSKEAFRNCKYQQSLNRFILYIDSAMIDRPHGNGYWLTENGSSYTTDVGYAEDWWNNCMKPELLRVSMFE